MEQFRLWTRITLTLVVLNLASASPASSQGRSAGRTRNPDNSGTTTVVPAPTPSPGRDVGRTRQPGTSPTRVPTGANDGGRSGRNGSTPTAGNVPSPRPERHPIDPAPPYNLPLPAPPPEQNEGVVVIEGGVPIEPIDGIWISERVSFGRDVTLCDERVMPEYSGYDFSDVLKRPYDHPFTDMSVESDSWGNLYMTVRDDTEIMDLGTAVVPVDAIFIPRRPWSADHAARLAVGHEYVVRTWDGPYAKFLVTSLLNDRVIFDWAYQSGERMAGVFPAVPAREERFRGFAR